MYFGESFRVFQPFSLSEATYDLYTVFLKSNFMLYTSFNKHNKVINAAFSYDNGVQMIHTPSNLYYFQLNKKR